MKKILLALSLIFISNICLSQTASQQQQQPPPSKFELDKLLHYGAGGLVSSISYLISYKVSDRIGLSMGIALTNAFLVGEAKELYDMNQVGKHFSNEDLIYTSFGGGTGVVCITIVIGTHERIKYNIED